MDLNAIFIRSVVYPMMSLVKGNRIMNYLQELKTTESLTPAEVTELQKQKLIKLLTHSIQTVPAYQKYSSLLQTADPDPFQLLKQIHVCTKAEVRKNGDDYISTAADRSKLIPNKTGGSTGEPTQFYMDRFTVEHYEAARWRALAWWGIKPGDRHVAILGNPSEYSTQHLRREKILKNRTILPGYDLRREQTEEYVRILRKVKPVYLYGYASAIYLLAKYIEEQQLPFDIRLNCIVTTAETLYPFQREQIERVFKTRVINEYGAKDGGIIAYECKQGHLHITAENAYLEIVDPVTREPLEIGQLGELLVTDLNNFSMPRLRYELGDMAALSEEPCACGNPLPILKHLEGRVDDMLLRRDGNAVPGHYFAHIAGNIQGFEKYQIVQKSLDHCVLKIIKNERFNLQEVDFIVDAIKEKLGGITVDIQYVDEIPPTKSGKQRLVIREKF